MSENTERLDAIQARLGAAEPGPWFLDTDGVSIYYVFHNGDTLDRDRLAESSGADAEFIAAAPSDVAFLLDLARKQQAAIDALSQWAGRSKTGYYDEAQDDVVQIIRPALEAKP